jgi:hypothetical protein
MKLAKRMKKDYFELIADYPFPPSCDDFYTYGYEDGISAMYTSMRKLKLDPYLILTVIRKIDPEGTSVAHALAEEYCYGGGIL